MIYVRLFIIPSSTSVLRQFTYVYCLENAISLLLFIIVSTEVYLGINVCITSFVESIILTYIAC